MNFKLFCEMYKDHHNLNTKTLTPEQLLDRWRHQRVVLKDCNLTYGQLLDKIEYILLSYKSGGPTNDENNK